MPKYIAPKTRLQQKGSYASCPFVLVPTAVTRTDCCKGRRTQRRNYSSRYHTRHSDLYLMLVLLYQVHRNQNKHQDSETAVGTCRPHKTTSSPCAVSHHSLGLAGGGGGEGSSAMVNASEEGVVNLSPKKERRAVWNLDGSWNLLRSTFTLPPTYLPGTATKTREKESARSPGPGLQAVKCCNIIGIKCRDSDTCKAMRVDEGRKG